MITLSVNLNKIALLRNSRDGGKPSVTDAAREAIARGAGGSPCILAQISVIFAQKMFTRLRSC